MKSLSLVDAINGASIDGVEVGSPQKSCQHFILPARLPSSWASIFPVPKAQHKLASEIDRGGDLDRM